MLKNLTTKGREYGMDFKNLLNERMKRKMMFDLEEKLEAGAEVLFVEGKKERPVAYTGMGKVILCKHRIPLGYAKVKSVEDKGRYFLVTADHIAKDLYSDIDYDDFIKVLPLFGYKIGFDRIFIHKDWNNEEHQIFAYNLENKVCIVAETFTWEGKGRVGFNTIKIYLPGKSVLDFGRNRLISQGSNVMTVFEVCTSDENGVLDYVSKVMKGVKEKKGEIRWPKNESPSMWTYEDDPHDENGHWVLFDRTIRRLKLADPECLKIFDGCEFLKKLN